MASQATIEAPDFDRIKREAGPETRDAIQLLWYVANNEATERRRGVRAAVEQSIRKVHSAAPAAAQHNYDSEGAAIVLFTGSTAFDLTGFRNPISGELKVVHNLGTGTVTAKHESASSAAAHRLDTAGDADVSITTGKTALFRYLNSRWRQEVLA